MVTIEADSGSGNKSVHLTLYHSDEYVDLDSEKRIIESQGIRYTLTQSCWGNALNKIVTIFYLIGSIRRFSFVVD